RRIHHPFFPEPLQQLFRRTENAAVLTHIFPEQEDAGIPFHFLGNCFGQRFVPSQDPIFCGHHLHTLPFIEMSEQTHHPGRLPPWDTDCHGHRRKLGPPPAGFGVPSFPDPSAVPLGPTTAVSSAGSDLSPLTAPLLLLLGTVPGLPGNGPATIGLNLDQRGSFPFPGPVYR